MLSLQEERESSKSLQACLGTILENRFLIKKVLLREKGEKPYSHSFVYNPLA